MRTKALGRYGTPDYVVAIMHLINEEYPDSLPTEFQVSTVLRYFWAYVEAQLKEDKDVSVFGIGKFSVNIKGNRHGTTQYYPKFKFSPHFVLRVRDYKGTLTPSEVEQVKKKKEFMRKVWENRRKYTLENRGKEVTSLDDIFKDLHTPQLEQ
jgi:hypothetical protein